MKSSRRRAREYALQGLYQWQLAGGTSAAIQAQLADDKNFSQADSEYFAQLLKGAMAASAELEIVITPALDRPIAQLSPIERAILILAAFELRDQLEIPYRVIINEAVELAKDFGGTDGFKYVNGVLDRIAPLFRPEERRSGGNA
jgi:transcription antitermination protein NusB